MKQNHKYQMLPTFHKTYPYLPVTFLQHKKISWKPAQAKIAPRLPPWNNNYNVGLKLHYIN